LSGFEPASYAERSLGGLVPSQAVGLPREVEVIDLDQLTEEPIEEAQLNTASEKMLEVMLRRQRLDTRSEEENRLLANTDARLMLSAIQLNTKGMREKDRRVLWAKCYIVTNSTRYIHAASELKLKNIARTSPQHLIGLLENIGGPKAADIDVLQLLENPLLTYVVNEMWPDLEQLLAHGVELNGKSLVRLRRDLDVTFHKVLVGIEENDRATQAGEADGEQIGAAKEDFVELICEAEQLGYGLHPMAKLARDAFISEDEKDQRVRELEARVGEYEVVIASFGRKKERYLRRMAGRNRSEH
jgi:hypothetical protein